MSAKNDLTGFMPVEMVIYIYIIGNIEMVQSWTIRENYFSELSLFLEILVTFLDTQNSWQCERSVFFIQLNRHQK